MSGQVSSLYESKSDGLTLRSVGSKQHPPLVLCSRQESHVVCQRVRRVHQFLLRVSGEWRFLVLFGFSFVPCAYGVCWLGQLTSLCVQGTGHQGVPLAGHTLWAEVGGSIILVTSWGLLCSP